MDQKNPREPDGLDLRGFPIPGLSFRGCPFSDRNESNSSAIRVRMAASGRRPRAAPRLSARCPTSVVPGIGQVTAGWEMMYLRQN